MIFKHIARSLFVGCIAWRLFIAWQVGMAHSSSKDDLRPASSSKVDIGSDKHLSTPTSDTDVPAPQSPDGFALIPPSLLFSEEGGVPPVVVDERRTTAPEIPSSPPSGKPAILASALYRSATLFGLRGDCSQKQQKLPLSPPCNDAPLCAAVFLQVFPKTFVREDLFESLVCNKIIVTISTNVTSTCDNCNKILVIMITNMFATYGKGLFN